MKRALKIVAVVLVVVLVGIQFVRPERDNPAVDSDKDLSAAAEVPKDVASILDRSCNDCHSNRTVWPWYSNVAPVSWSVADHVEEGRKELNFSVWGTYKTKRKVHKLEEVCEQVETGEMPHYQYLWIHGEASLSQADVKRLCEWSKDLAESIKAAGATEEDSQ